MSNGAPASTMVTFQGIAPRQVSAQRRENVLVMPRVQPRFVLSIVLSIGETTLPTKRGTASAWTCAGRLQVYIPAIIRQLTE